MTQLHRMGEQKTDEFPNSHTDFVKREAFRWWLSFNPFGKILYRQIGLYISPDDKRGENTKICWETTISLGKAPPVMMLCPS